MNQYIKRFSVDLGGRIVAVFDNEDEARAFVSSCWFYGIANIYDNEKHSIIFTEVLI